MERFGSRDGLFCITALPLVLLFLLALVLAAAAPVLAISANITIVSDNTTMVLSGNVPGASYPHPAVLAWQPYDPSNDCWDTSITGHTFSSNSKWIWESYRVVHPLAGDIVDFKKTFVIPGNPTAGTLYITCDNAYELRVNGNLVGSAQFEPNWRTSNLTESFVHTDNWQSVESWDISPWLVCGTNRIEIAAANEYFGPLDSQSDGNININPAGLIFEASVAYEITSPTVATDNATQVEETTATLNGTLNNDGGEASQYRFEYDTDSGTPYAFSTPWTGSLTSDQPFSASITSLSKGTKYYFRTQAKNSAGTSSGSELTLLTKPDPPVAVSASVNGTQINLSWTKGQGANRTLVRRRTGGYPADRNEGVQVYFDTGTSMADTGLTPNTTYYYKSWSEVSGSQQWSNGFAVVVATTGSGITPTPPPVAVGGTVYPVSKARVLAPWLILLLALGVLIVGGYLGFVNLKKGGTHCEFL